MRFFRFLLGILAFALIIPRVIASGFSDESLNYRVMYKWGLVNKQAGHATLSLRNEGDRYELLLTAASEPWADRFYRVRDTLAGTVEIADFRPVIYKKMSHEGGDYKYDVVTYSYSGNTVTGHCSRRLWDKSGKLKIDQKHTVSAIGQTVDMLSSFYLMRSLPYQRWKPGHTESINIFSGKRREILSITYIDEDNITVDKTNYSTYHISFTFTDPNNPKRQTSDPMEAWISTSHNRIPIKLEGKLKVGKVQCFYMP